MKLFGTDGIRGIAGQYPLDEETVRRIGFAAAKVLKNRKSKAVIFLGRDTRESGDLIASNLKKGLASKGVEVWDIGVIPTPVIAYMVKEFPALAGIVISASHNAYKDNGIKFFGPEGTKLPDQVEGLIEKEILRKPPVSGAAKKKNVSKHGKLIDKTSLSGSYIEFLKSTLPKNFTLKGMRLVIDCANGAAYSVASEIFSSLGADVSFINQNPDGKNINLDCGSLHPENLSNEVQKQKAVCGFAFDGDGDRVIFVDENGEIRDGDYLLAISAEFLKKNKKLKNNLLVTTVMANLGLYKAMEEMGIEILKTPVGDRYVYENMVKSGAVLGGEQSGHIIFRDFLPTGDGILSALQILSIIKQKDKPFSVLCNIMKKYPQILLNTRVSHKTPIHSLRITSGIIRETQRKLDSDGRVLVRYSGTENLLRVMIEGRDSEIINKMAQRISDAAVKEIDNLK